MIILGLLTVFGPISMDLYLPVLPALGEDLGTTTSLAQVTITACLIGLAFGQVVVGPLSDRFGRRRPLLAGIGIYVIASVLCAISPSIEVLIIARLLQGLAGSTGMVIAQASGRDHFSGARLVRYYGNLSVLTGVAAIIGPVLGGQLALITDWRGIFTALAGLGGLIWLASLIALTESHPADRRAAGGLRTLPANLRLLLADRTFVGAILVVGFVSAAIFAYLGGATYVLQGIHRLSPQQYSYVFALGSLTLVICGYLSGRLSARFTPGVVLPGGLALCLVGAAGILAQASLSLPLPILIGSILALTGGTGAITPPATAIALAEYPRIAGTAASVLGLTRYAMGAIAAPLGGVAGEHTAVPLGVVASIGAVLALVVYLAVLRRSGP